MNLIEKADRFYKKYMKQKYFKVEHVDNGQVCYAVILAE